MKTAFTGIRLEAVLPKTTDTILGAVGNSFAVRLPWGGAMPRIMEQKRDGFSFEVESYASLSVFSDYGEMLVSEEGRKSRITLRLDMRGSLLALYVLHWLFFLLLVAVHFLFVPLFSGPVDIPGLLFAVFVFMLWPLLLFRLLQLQQRRRLEVFLSNLIYYV